MSFLLKSLSSPPFALHTHTLIKSLSHIPPHILFTAISNVAAYSEFVPYVSESKVLTNVNVVPDQLDTIASSFKARLTVGFSPPSTSLPSVLTESYTSLVTCSTINSSRYLVTSTSIDSSTFSLLKSTWDIRPLPSSSESGGGGAGGGCAVKLVLEYQVRDNAFKDVVIRESFERIQGGQMKAFVERAEILNEAQD